MTARLTILKVCFVGRSSKMMCCDKGKRAEGVFGGCRKGHKRCLGWRVTRICRNPRSSARTFRAFLRARITRAHQILHPCASPKRVRRQLFLPTSVSISRQQHRHASCRKPARYVEACTLLTAPPSRQDHASRRGRREQSRAPPPQLLIRFSPSAMGGRTLLGGHSPRSWPREANPEFVGRYLISIPT